jgi:hypothetical protein
MRKFRGIERKLKDEKSVQIYEDLCEYLVIYDEAVIDIYIYVLFDFAADPFQIPWFYNSAITIIFFFHSQGEILFISILKAI